MNQIAESAAVRPRPPGAHPARRWSDQIGPALDLSPKSRASGRESGDRSAETASDRAAWELQRGGGGRAGLATWQGRHLGGTHGSEADREGAPREKERKGSTEDDRMSPSAGWAGWRRRWRLNGAP
ncbi:unnamed protein product [Lampetra planeri]